MRVDYSWRVGLEFSSIAEFKIAFTEYALLEGRDIRNIKNDKLRSRVKCCGQDCEIRLSSLRLVVPYFIVLIL